MEDNNQELAAELSRQREETNNKLLAAAKAQRDLRVEFERLQVEQQAQLHKQLQEERERVAEQNRLRDKKYSDAERRREERSAEERAQKRRRWEEMREEDRRGWEAENARLREEIASVRESSSSPISLSVIHFLHGSDDSPEDDSDNDLSSSGDRNKISASGPVPSALPLLAVLAGVVTVNPFIVAAGFGAALSQGSR